MAWMIANLLFAIPAAASTSLVVEGSRLENELKKKIGEALRFNFALMVPGIILIQLLAGFMLGLFGAGYSANGALLLRVLAFSGIFSCVNSVYGSILRLKNRIKEIEIIVIFKAIALVAGCYFILPVAGIIGIGYVWTAVQGLIAIYVLFAGKSIYSVKPSKKTP
jgi:O-antigen/teichoic acid export membrane protein